jgi:hypothetical protein
MQVTVQGGAVHAVEQLETVEAALQGVVNGFCGKVC